MRISDWSSDVCSSDLHNNHAWLMDNMPNDRTVVDTPFEVWERTMAVNLRGYFAASKYAVPHMIAQGGGSVINTSSDSDLRTDTDNISYGLPMVAIVMSPFAMSTQHGHPCVRTHETAQSIIGMPTRQ